MRFPKDDEVLLYIPKDDGFFWSIVRGNIDPQTYIVYEPLYNSIGRQRVVPLPTNNIRYASERCVIRE